MKAFATVLLLAVTVAFAARTAVRLRPVGHILANLKPDNFDGITDNFVCKLCLDIVEDEETWADEEGNANEEGILRSCRRALQGALGPAVANYLCEVELRDELDKIITYLNDPANIDASAHEACTYIGLCDAKAKFLGAKPPLH